EPVLLKVLAQSHEQQPVPVHKQAVEALVEIGATSDAAVDALLAIQFQVPDSPGTQSVGERAVRALAGIGEPAVARALDMLKGKIEAVNKAAAENGVDLLITHQFAVKVLGAIGSTKATEDLVAFMPTDDCAAGSEIKSVEDMDAAQVGLRAVVARSLGEIGDPAAAGALCGCKDANHNDGDLWEITMALGRIGGDEAFQCLSKIVTEGEYNPEDLPNSDFRYEIRWEGARFMVLAGGPDNVGDMRKAIADQSDAKVKENIGKWEEG